MICFNTESPVSLPVQNGILALLAYTGIGNVPIQPITEPIATDEQETGTIFVNVV